MDKLHFVAGFLFKNEIMDADQFETVMEAIDNEVTFEQLEEISAEVAEKMTAG